MQQFNSRGGEVRPTGDGGCENQCASCPVRSVGLCDAVIDIEAPRSGAVPLSFGTAKARQKICRSGEPAPHVLLLCRGWAYRFVVLPDGRRQIVDFILPGQLFSIAAPFRQRHSATVQTLTKVRYGLFERESLQAELLTRKNLMQRVAELCIEDMDRLEGSLADLGRRSALERVARLLLSLVERLDRRNMVTDMECDFPVRQEHIADATGLTPIHVGRMLRQMRSDGIIELISGRLRVIDMSELRRAAEEPH